MSIAFPMVLALITNVSFFFSFFTPLFIALSYVRGGRAWGTVSVLCGFLLTLALEVFDQKVFGDYTIITTFAGCAVLGIIIGELFLNKVAPLKGVAVTGTVLSVLFLSLLGGSLLSLGDKEKKELRQSYVSWMDNQRLALEKNLKSSEEKSDESFELLTWLERPEKLLEKVMIQAPGYLVMGIFVILWVNFALLLKSFNLTPAALVHFRLPDQLVFGVILGFVLAIWGDTYHPYLEATGLTLLRGLGVFYFFQGFGIYLTFLTAMGVGGIFRSFLVVFTIFTAAQVVALFGLFDMFFNFRRFLVKKND